MLSIVGNVLNVFVLSLNNSIIAKNISAKKLTTKDIFIITLLIFCPSFFVAILNINYLLVPISLVITFLYYFFRLKNLYYSIFISVFIQAIFALSDAIVGISVIYILKIDYSQISNNKITTLIVSFAIVVMSYITSKIIIELLEKHFFSTLTSMMKRNAVILILCMVAALFSMYSYTMIFKAWYQTPKNIVIILNLFSVISFFILFIIIVHFGNTNIKNHLENKHKDVQLKQLQEYTEMLESVSSDLRSFKHDYINIIQIIGGYLDSNEFDALDKFYRNELMPESKKIIDKDRYFMLLKHIKINPLKGLISSKIIIAQSKGINIKFEVFEDIDEIPMSLIDICRIVGALLDNAIEAAEVCNNKFIEFLITRNESCITFSINNSCSQDTPPIFKIYEKNFSTKGDGRGIGLKSVRNIMNEKYTNIILNTNIENSVFKQELIISLL